MKKDYRWDLTKPLGHDEKEQYFQDHVLQLREKKRLQFRKLLSDATEVRRERDSDAGNSRRREVILYQQVFLFLFLVACGGGRVELFIIYWNVLGMLKVC